MITGSFSVIQYALESSLLMLKFKNFETFKDQQKNQLIANEAMNSVFIGTLLQINENSILNFGSLSDGINSQLSWILTNDQTLILSEGNDHLIFSLYNFLCSNLLPFQRIRGPSHLTNEIIKLSSFNAQRSMTQNIYELQRKININTELENLRSAQISDLEELTPWIESYILETNLEHKNYKDLLLDLIKHKRLFILSKNGINLSMIACSSPTYTGIRINLLYTPREYRYRGYGSLCISSLCNYLLDTGFEKCFIFADQDNHITNSMYRKIGCCLIGSFTDCSTNSKG